GLANGANTGMAPDANIVVVETDFSRPNWTLTVVDACDFIFKIADSLGMPAVVNISLGSYFGSHDGNDPAANAMEGLLDAKKGRIIVSAAGNSGNVGKYHLHGEPTADTNFVWFQNNPSGAFGANTIFFDLWSDEIEATYDFALGCNLPSGAYSDRGRSLFHPAMSSIGIVINDTIWNGSDRIATYEAYTEIINGNYHLQLVIAVDSTAYNYRFETTGSGSFDLWSGSVFGYNNMVLNTPSSTVFPDSIYYIEPDANQTIVSSWNCSEKIVSVANMRNRASFIDFNLNNYTNADTTPPEKLSPNSSKGPNRHNVTKPDITAAGDVSLCAVPFTFLSNPANYNKVDSGGWHATNGGTSMASPVVAGIAALYLERCNRATHLNFLSDLHSQAYADLYSGITPNNAYGYGKAHALNTLLQESLAITPTITSDWQTATLTSSETTGNEWYLNDTVIIGATNQDYTASAPYGSYQVLYTNMDGCSSFSSPLILSVGIEEINDNLMTSYPNPTNSIIQIDFDGDISSISIVDSQGKICTIDKLTEKTYNLENLPAGNYLIRINTNKGVYTSKIVRL
ncbi:MAG TPA: T9SS type A sorting domain-containing protein, partial [Crocinitomicaceae bacterium]|nr:T9SS type A sorting domain-containing protein [Crocinitomicaceae bacterium]